MIDIDRFNELVVAASAGLKERDEIIANALLAILSGQSVFFFGPPGTAKSLIARRLAGVFKYSTFFECLMNRFTTPEEMFGPVSIKELKSADRYIRKTDGFLPSADFAFLDEIWKSSPAILNALLTILNERKFRNGDKVEDVPLKALVAAICASYARVKGVVKHPQLGIIRLTKAGTNDSLRHGYGREKLVAFSALPEIIEKGVIVQQQRNWKGRAYDSYVLAAPINIAGEAFCAFVVVNKMVNGDRNYYLHEVARLSQLKKSAEELRSSLSPRGGKVGSPFGLMRIIANSIFADKQEKNDRKTAATTPEQVFNYIYAVLHTPEYRERYKEFLKVDFPRIPYPKSGEVFMKLAAIGEKLIAVHLLKDPATQMMFDPHAKFPISGTGRVDALKYAVGGAVGGGTPTLPRVYINAEQYFDNVPETAWTFFIGGYQPAQKWLKDRKGRTLSADDVMHYKSIVIALLETEKLMEELSALSSEWLCKDGARG